MAHLLSEQEVLKKLDIKSFGRMNKQKSVHFVSMLDKMEPEVAKKALEQFPEFSKISKEILSGYKDTLDRCMEANNTSIKAVYDNCNAIIFSLQKELEREDLSFEEKSYIIEQMKIVADMIAKKDTENKNWIKEMAIIGGSILLGGIALLAMAIGGSASVKSSDSEPDVDSELDEY